MNKQVREKRIDNWFDSVISDCRFGLRQLRRTPGFAVVAVLTLALGIGANTAVFSIVDAVLLSPLPFERPSELVALHEGVPKLDYRKMGFSAPDLAVFEREQKSFSAIGAFQSEHLEISGNNQPERVMAARVSASLFPMLGAKPVLGRTFTSQEDVPGSNLVILSFALWQRRFGGGDNVIGQTIDLNRQPYSIVGVMPQDFKFPLPGLAENGSPADLWVPMAYTKAESEDWGGSYVNSVIGRLRSGVTIGQASAEVKSLGNAIVAYYPPALTEAFKGSIGLTVTTTTLQEEVVGSVRPLLVVVMAGVAFVLLIACANIAMLLVSRATSREKEIGIRSALGATNRRLMRQMLTESLLLAGVGGGLGIALAYLLRDSILIPIPSGIPLPHHVSLHAGVFVFAFCISILAALIFGLAPVFHVSFQSTHQALQNTARTHGRLQRRLQGVLVGVQFALTLVLLVGAGLLVRSFDKLVKTSPGFRPESVLTMNVPLPSQAYPKGEQIQNFYKQLYDRVSALSGAQVSGLSSDLPLNAREKVSMTIEGGSYDQGATPQSICQSWVLGDYFQAMGIPLMQGRLFTPDDRFESERVAIVSLATARKFWPSQNAIGKRIRWGRNAPWHRIVGIVGDVQQGPFSAPILPHVYRPYLQLPAPFLEEDPFSDWHALNLAVRTQFDPKSLASTIIGSIHSLDPNLAVSNVQTMTELIDSTFVGPRFNMALLTGLAALALLLSAIGIYGVLAYVVTQQTREIGVRMALGAKRRVVFGLILARGARLAGIGIICGLIAAFGLTRLMKNLLYGVSAIDPLTFIAVVLVLVVVGLLASYIPARRAMRVDPMVSLRYE